MVDELSDLPPLQKAAMLRHLTLHARLQMISTPGVHPMILTSHGNRFENLCHALLVDM
jgi:hypothetical protein